MQVEVRKASRSTRPVGGRRPNDDVLRRGNHEAHDNDASAEWIRARVMMLPSAPSAATACYTEAARSLAQPASA